ncbi:MAG: hypothetical protein HY658_09230 [Actinobacteria bacterium]|nr:hypothetical protein [Actinomycetota bacterium]
MVLAAVLLLAGAVLLSAGAEVAVRSAGRVALSLGISAFVIGAVLFGIDLEGLGTTVLAASRGATALAAGEAFGTVLFVTSFAFGIALLVAGEPVPSPSAAMVVAPSLPLAGAGMALYDGSVARLEGGILLAMYAAYVTVVIGESRALRARAGQVEREAAEVGGSRRRVAWLLAGGMAGLAGGAWLLVEGGVRLLERTGLRAGFVGAGILAVLSGLDEVLLEVLPVRRGRPELATGNLMGTVAAFPSAVLGIAALVTPIASDSAANSSFVAGTALYALIASAFLLRGKAGTLLGVVLVLAYPSWLLLTGT